MAVAQYLLEFWLLKIAGRAGKSARWANDEATKGAWRARRDHRRGQCRIAVHARARSCAVVDKIKGVYSSPGLSFAGLFLAERMGLWAKNGLKAEVKQVQGGPLAMVALTNREAQFAGVASTDPVVGWDKGIKTLTISAFTGSLDMQITARNDWMSQVGSRQRASLRTSSRRSRELASALRPSAAGQRNTRATSPNRSVSTRSAI